ncbi:MAG: PAS domain S-box protein, partial [Ignavibacteriales bacterium]|nr:PAS domain S-box protein [Ignavibacteriales bacterium]
MGSFHRLLDRQLKRYFGSEENISPKWNKFLDAVNAAYIASDEDRAMVEHSLELSSQEMLQTNAQMRGMFQAFPDVYFHMDASGKILQFASGSTDSLFGASENLLGKRLSDVLPKEVSAKVESALQEVFRTNSLVLVEYSLIERNEEKIFEARFVPYAGNQVSTIIRDVTLQKQEENALKLFRTLMDNSSDAIEVLDPRSLRYLDVNKKACEELGYSRNELLSLSVFDIDPNVTASSYAEAEDIKQKGAQTLESQHKRKDGSMFPVEVNVTFVSLDRDYLVSVVRNITERKRVEEKLAESEERFRTLFEGMMDGVYRSTHEGKFVDVNHSMIQMFGYANREEMLQVDIKKELYFAEEDRESHFLDTGTEKVEIFRMRRKDGAEIWVEDHGRYVHDEHGKVIFHEGVLRDVTERKLIEERIRNNEEQLQLFIEHTPASIAMFDTEMKYLVASRQWHVNYNLREENIIGKSHYEVFPEIPDRWKEIHKRCLAGATEKCEEDQFPRLDGTVDWVRWEIIPWHKSNGEIGGIILFTELITERKKLEEQLRQSQKMESIGVLAGGIAHDFNNLLGIIGGYASLLERKKNDPEKFSQNIEAITAAVTRGASLVKQMLTFARKANIVLESVNVQALLEEISAMCQQTFPKTITFSVHSEPNLPSILGDANQLHQALLNICVNARDA